MTKRSLFRAFAFAAMAVVAAGAANAQTAINQFAASAGGVTPGDAPGFPVTLSTPGHYVLTSNLVVPAGAIGIHITAPNVTLNLNGFSIIGPVSCSDATGTVTCIGPTTGSASGIYAAQNGTTIRNGHVRGFPDTGIYMRGGIVEDVQVESNDNYGIFASGAPGDQPSRISGVRVTLIRGAGILSRRAIIERAVLSRSGLGASGQNFVLVDSLVERNVQHGVQDTSSGGSQPVVLRGTVMHSNGGPSLSSPATRSLGGNLIDGVAF